MESMVLALIALAAGWAAARWYAARSQEPSEKLSAEASRIVSAQDYAGKVEAAGPIAECINHLLLQIRFRDVQLEREREQLEDRVAERTSQLERLTEQMRAEKERAEEAARSKAMFLANMSHEIRTPMNGIMGMADLVLESSLTSQQHECLSTIRSSAESLLTVVNDVLDFAKIEAGKLELVPEKFRLRESLAAAMDSLALAAEAKGLELTCRVEPGVPDALVGDAGRLRQVLLNLVGNSIKFTERGEIAVEARAESEMLGRVTLEFSVRDTGVGIPPDRQGALFKPFEQADNTATRKYGGTGLGLAIVAELARLMGGRAWMESEPGQGSTFHFTAQLGLQRASQETQPDPLPIPDRRVLLVDDNVTSLTLLEELSRGWKLEPVCAPDAARALEAAAGKSFPLLVIDAEMPGTDGFSLVEKLRRTPGFSGSIVLLLSQTDRLDKAARSQSLGVKAFVAKPIAPAELLRALRVAAGLEAPAPRHAASQATGAARPLRVLLAEDNPVNRALALQILNPRGHDITVATDGEEAVDAFARKEHDVCLMDVSMPKLSGLEATQAIRRLERETGKRLRILAVTAHALKGDRERCLEAGMDGYITKPIRPAELIEAIEGVAPAATGPAPMAISAGTGALGRETLLEKFDGNLDAFREIANIYLENAPRFMADIKSSLAGGDAASLTSAAHSLKGTLTIFSVQSAFEAALRLEKLARAGDLTQAASALSPLESEVGRVNDAIQSLMAG